MKSRKFFKPTLATTLAIVLAGLLSVRTAQAGYTVTLQQVGPNVVATGSGAINLTGLSFISDGVDDPGIDAGLGVIATGPFATRADTYQGFTGPTSFGSGSPFSPSTASGDFVEMSGVGQQLFVPHHYVSDTPLSDSMTFNNATLATLGVTPGTYVWIWGTGANQNFTLVIPGAVLQNISSRAFVQTSDNVMIGGFMVQGTEPKRVIIRAIGPDLTQHGVADALANPTLELHDGTGALIASNNNWITTIIGGIITSNQVREIRASGFAPGDPFESAIIADLRAGNYTAIVRGVNNTTGVALVEVYSLSPESNSILNNISARAFVQTGDNVMIGGFIVQGTEPKRVIIRAIGPDLTQYGVPDALANPTLELHDGTGAMIASNNNWATTITGGIITSNQVHEIQTSGYAPGDPLDSAIIADLPAGNYTAIVRGVNNLTGVALVEVYDLD
jgi:hypothetical protein